MKLINVKKIFSLFLFMLLTLPFLLIDVNAVEKVKEEIAFPEFTDETFSNFGWNCTMSKGIVEENAKNGKALKIEKSAISDVNNHANVYYQSFGSTITALADGKEIYGIKLDIYSSQSIDSGGLMFLFDGTEQGTVEAYAEDSDVNLETRDLNYIGFRTYIIVFPNEVSKNANEFQIGIWGSDLTTIFVSNIRLLVLEGDDQEPNPVEREEIAFPDFTNATFTNYGWNCVMEKQLLEENSKVGKSVLISKKSISDDNNNANIYYQSFGSIVEGLAKDKILYGVKLDIYSVQEMNESGLLFKFGGIEQAIVEAYAEDSDVNLATRDLNYVGYRTYVIKFPNPEAIKTVTEFQIGVWGKDIGDIYLSNLRLVLSETEVPTDPIDPDDPDDTEFEKRPAKSYLLEGFNSDDSIANWGISGTSGTIYVKSFNDNDEYLTEGAGSLKYTYLNELYGFGYTEIYLDVTSFVEKNVSKNLKGISFEIYNTSEQTLGAVGWWIKIAEKDGSEYESNYAFIEDGTGLNFTGWKDIYVPFSAVNNLQSYTVDDNNQLDIDQIAYIKFGFWTNKAEIVDIETYIDNIKVWSDEEIKEEEPTDIPTDPKTPDENKGCMSGCKSNSIGKVTTVLLIFGGLMILFRRKGQIL